jgi:hypothetical protein
MMLNAVKTRNPFGGASQQADPLPHFAPFFPDEALRQRWDGTNARRAESGDLFASPNTGFHHNPMESDVSYLYVAASPNYPGEVKIGMSRSRPDQRLKKASTDIAFRKDPDVEIKAFFMIKNARAKDVEAATHKLLERFRSDPVMRGAGHDGTGEREWFAIDPFEAMSAVELAARTYADPKRVSHLSGLIKSGMDDLDTILILEDLAPGFLDKQEYALTDLPRWKPEGAERVSALFDELHGISFGRPTKWKETERTDIVIVPIGRPPDRYFWDYAHWLIPQREELMGTDITDIYPGTGPGILRSLDASTPEHQPFLRNGVVVGSISREGSIDLDLTLKSGPFGRVDRSTEVLYETDLVSSPLAARITDLYWDLRERLDQALPPPENPGHVHEKRWRTEYLHRLSSILVGARPEDLSPRTAQALHSAAMKHAGTPIDMSVCPLEVCEIARPILERSGRTAELPSDAIGASPA